MSSDCSLGAGGDVIEEGVPAGKERETSNCRWQEEEGEKSRECRFSSPLLVVAPRVSPDSASATVSPSSYSLSAFPSVPLWLVKSACIHRPLLVIISLATGSLVLAPPRLAKMSASAGDKSYAGATKAWAPDEPQPTPDTSLLVLPQQPRESSSSAIETSTDRSPPPVYDPGVHKQDEQDDGEGWAAQGSDKPGAPFKTSLRSLPATVDNPIDESLEDKLAEPCSLPFSLLFCFFCFFLLFLVASPAPSLLPPCSLPAPSLLPPSLSPCFLPTPSPSATFDCALSDSTSRLY